MISALFNSAQLLSPRPNQRVVGQGLGASCKKDANNAGRKESPSYAIIDFQSVKTAAASEERGIDGGKNKGQEAAHRSGCAWLFAVCCSSCR